ncbi:MAG: hypothetical protein WC699_02780 [Bacteroidales bacterium]|jgi:hypothetical protein
MPNRPSNIHPPKRSPGVLGDIWYFLLRKPGPDTLLRFQNAGDRDNYNKRILQRLGIKPDNFTILNIHQIDVNAPPSYVFNELLKWSGDSTCWPNYIARFDRIMDELENIRILPFGWSKYPFGMKSLMGFKLIPLFLMNAIRFKSIPDSFDFDNARYLLYKCSGGYPIGFFSMYVRSTIAELGETGPTKLFVIVGFNFYGKKDWAKKKFVNRIWQAVHNRVTSNVLYRLKMLCEWRLDKIHTQPDLLKHFESDLWSSDESCIITSTPIPTGSCTIPNPDSHGDPE